MWTTSWFYLLLLITSLTVYLQFPQTFYPLLSTTCPRFHNDAFIEMTHQYGQSDIQYIGGSYISAENKHRQWVKRNKTPVQTLNFMMTQLFIREKKLGSYWENVPGFAPMWHWNFIGIRMRNADGCMKTWRRSHCSLTLSLKVCYLSKCC